MSLSSAMVVFSWPSTLKTLPRSVPTTKQNIMIPVKYLFVYFVYDLIFSGGKILMNRLIDSYYIYIKSAKIG
ncbi:hypothetical protein C1646_681960 [Rhizophagus diaphanus]|nr:hypothetical protein C1646_681960 [Rhizophagus diaphanus] [Rhizophagus sp. MUCL 43196]